MESKSTTTNTTVTVSTPSWTSMTTGGPAAQAYAAIMTIQSMLVQLQKLQAELAQTQCKAQQQAALVSYSATQAAGSAQAQATKLEAISCFAAASAGVASVGAGYASSRTLNSQKTELYNEQNNISTVRGQLNQNPQGQNQDGGVNPQQELTTFQNKVKFDNIQDQNQINGMSPDQKATLRTNLDRREAEVNQEINNKINQIQHINSQYQQFSMIIQQGSQGITKALEAEQLLNKAKEDAEAALNQSINSMAKEATSGILQTMTSQKQESDQALQILTALAQNSRV